MCSRSRCLGLRGALRWRRRSAPLPLIVCAAGIAAAASGLAVAQPPVPDNLQPLVKLHDTHVLDAGPAVVSSTDADVFVARGGDLVDVAVTRQIAAGGSFQTDIAEGTASPATLAALQNALGAGHPGVQSGVCFAELLPLGSTFRYTISWFGLHGRSTTFTLTNQGDAAGACSAAEIAMATAIFDFVAAVLADPATTHRHSTCSANADCGGGQLCCPACAVPDCAKQCHAPVNGGCPLIP